MTCQRFANHCREKVKVHARYVEQLDRYMTFSCDKWAQNTKCLVLVCEEFVLSALAARMHWQEHFTSWYA